MSLFYCPRVIWSRHNDKKCSWVASWKSSRCFEVLLPHVATWVCRVTAKSPKLPVSQCPALSVRGRPFNFWLQTVAIREGGGGELDMIQIITAVSVRNICKLNFCIQNQKKLLLNAPYRKGQRNDFWNKFRLFCMLCEDWRGIHEVLILFPDNWGKDAVTFSSSVAARRKSKLLESNLNFHAN